MAGRCCWLQITFPNPQLFGRMKSSVIVVFSIRTYTMRWILNTGCGWLKNIHLGSKVMTSPHFESTLNKKIQMLVIWMYTSMRKSLLSNSTQNPKLSWNFTIFTDGWWRPSTPSQRTVELVNGWDEPMKRTYLTVKPDPRAPAERNVSLGLK